MEKKLTWRGFDPGRIALEETIFHTANGYLGVRGCLEEGVPQGIRSIRGTYLNGFYNLKSIPYGEKLYGFPTEQECMVNVVDAQTIRLSVDGAACTPFSGTPLEYERTLDMVRGISIRAMAWTAPKGQAVHVTIERLASFEEPSLFLIRYAVESVDFTGTLRFQSLQNGDVTAYANPDDPRVAQDAARHVEMTALREVDGVDLMTLRTLRSGLTMANAVCHRLNGEPAGREAKCSIRPAERVVLEKWCVYKDSRRARDPGEAALACLQGAMSHPAEYWFESQAAHMAAFWQRAGVTIEGDPALQAAMDFSLYQLLQSAGRDSLSNVAAKGLSGEGYEGHYFWDSEIYIFPFFLLTDHGRAKDMLRYRHGILDAARAHARVMGHSRGALYPWRTIAGRECSSYYPSGSAQYHLTGDVAFAFAQYYRLTRDITFMAETGAEVLIETARLWLDAGHMLDGVFRIDNVTGPDEYTCIVNNNYFTNACARENLRAAAEICDALEEAGLFANLRERLSVTREDREAFRAAADAMYIPYDKKLGIYSQDDTFLSKKRLDLTQIPPENFPLLLHYHPLYLYRRQVLKQADAVLAHFLFEEGVSQEDMERTYDYYEPITTHDSSLSPCVYGIMAARLGNLQKALHYFHMTCRMDLDNTHGNTQDGIHTANLGGTYLGVTMGFAGLRVTSAGVSLRPRLPDGWQGYGFSFLASGESRVSLRMTKEGPRLALLEGPPVFVWVDGVRVRVGDGERGTPVPPPSILP